MCMSMARFLRTQNVRHSKINQINISSSFYALYFFNIIIQLVVVHQVNSDERIKHMPILYDNYCECYRRLKVEETRSQGLSIQSHSLPIAIER